MKYKEVGVTCSTRGGWNGVGVGEGFGAEVIKTKGNGAGVGAVTQAASRIVTRKVNLRMDDFIRFLKTLKFTNQRYKMRHRRLSITKICDQAQRSGRALVGNKAIFKKAQQLTNPGITRNTGDSLLRRTYNKTASS